MMMMMMMVIKLNRIAECNVVVLLYNMIRYIAICAMLRLPPIRAGIRAIKEKELTRRGLLRGCLFAAAETY